MQHDLATRPRQQERQHFMEAKRDSGLTAKQEKFAALLDHARNTAMYVPVLLAVTTGLRRDELSALRCCDVDLKRGTLAVVQSLEETKDGLHMKAPKTERGRRVVSLPSMAVETLRQHKIEQAQQRLQLGLGRDENAVVCGRYNGQPRTAPRPSQRRLMAKSKLPTISFHGLRHSHATALLRAGVHPRVAQERLGHSTIATTLDLYSHVTETMQNDAAQRVDTALRVAINERTKEEN